tara:strand:+ start:1148 stop:1594 length:447 start_codon:yes stop_codon:yes gene_type:complete
MKRIANLLTIFPLLFMQGCGFHLINTNKPLAVCVQGNEAETIRLALNTLICTKQSKILIIKASYLGEQRVANSTNNAVNQFQLTQFVVFDLLSPSQKVIKKDVLLTVNKPFISNNSAILSSDAERVILVNEMKDELHAKLNRYLSNLD